MLKIIRIANPVSTIISTIFILILLTAPLLSAGNMAEHAKKYNSLGFTKLIQGKYSEAEYYFIKAILLNPLVKYYYNNLAVIYMKQKRYREAYKYLLICLSLDNNYIKALTNTAITSFYMFKFKDAYYYYIKALRADPDYTRKRFRKKNVLKKLDHLIKENPENKKLRFIHAYLKKK